MKQYSISPVICSVVFTFISILSGNSLWAVKIALIQYEIKDMHEIGVDANRLESFIREAAGKGAELVVAPETSFYRYEPWELNGVTMLDLAGHFEELRARFSDLADELDISIVIGLREPSGDKEKPVYNTALFLGPDGAILGKQHKVFPSNAEMAWTRAGNRHHVFETRVGRVGMMICKTAKTNWWNSFRKEDDLDLFILIAGDDDATSFSRFSSILVKSNCHGLIANQICGPDADDKARKGNSAWGYPDGRVEFLGGGEKIFYKEWSLPVRDEFGPQYGQIIVDPENPAWLVYNRDKDGDGRLDPYFLCGPGDPEGFLYRGRRNPDGTRQGDQEELIEKIRQNGGNCIYLMAVRTHGGDAWKDLEEDPANYPDKQHNPWVGQDPAYGLNPDILDQWEGWFTEMDRNGITTYLFIYDDAIRVGEQIGWPLDGQGNLHPGEKQFLQDLVNRFEHHRNLIWCIMEEGQEIGTDWQLHISKIAEAIREADDHDHVIATHQLGGNVFYHADDPNIDQFSIQGNWETGNTPDSVHNWLVSAWEGAGGKFNLNMAEHRAHEGQSRTGDREGIRKHNWAIAMAGSYLMVLGMEIMHTPEDQLKDCRNLQKFFESTPINAMSPHDELKYAGTQYVLASPGYTYILYASGKTKKLGLRGMASGKYHMKWYDCVSGESLEQNNVDVARGDQSWKKPKEFGDEAALFIGRADGKAKPETSTSSGTNKGSTMDKALKGGDKGNIIAEAPDQQLTTKKDTPLYIQLTYNDPDGGPGPYHTIILIQPSYGKLSGVGNDQTYTPEKGYTGDDRFTWKVNDGAGDSEISTIHITIEP